MKKVSASKKIEKTQKIAIPRRIDMALLKAYGWSEEAPNVRFEFKKTLKLAKFPPAKLPANSLLRLGCSAAGKKLGYAGKAVPAAGIEARPPKNFAELKRVNRSAHRDYLKTWGKKAGGFFLTAAKKYETKYLPKTRSLVMLRKGKPVALYSLLKFPARSGIVDVVAWHGPFVKLSAKELRSVKHQASVWLNSAARHHLAVGLDYFDKESLRFFAGLGFKVDRILVVRM